MGSSHSKLETRQLLDDRSALVLLGSDENSGGCLVALLTICQTTVIAAYDKEQAL